ncbi:hypothetical protein BB561_004250, partial [Smittium simulii]
SKISEWISNNDIGFSRNLTDLELLYPEHSSVIQKIIKIRIGCFNTALKLAKSKTLADEYLNKCPFCNKFEPETVEHYLFKCSKWTDQRQSILGEYISQPNLIVPGSTCSKLLGTLLGEELKFNYAGILKNASTPAVKSVLSTAQFLTATSTTRAITFKELIVAPDSCPLDPKPQWYGDPIMGCGSSTALSRLRDELKIATVNTRTAVARERAYYKCPTLNTWMPALMTAPMKSRLSTWVSGATKWG